MLNLEEEGEEEEGVPGLDMSCARHFVPSLWIVLC